MNRDHGCDSGDQAQEDERRQEERGDRMKRMDPAEAERLAEAEEWLRAGARLGGRRSAMILAEYDRRGAELVRVPSDMAVLRGERDRCAVALDAARAELAEMEDLAANLGAERLDALAEVERKAAQVIEALDMRAFVVRERDAARVALEQARAEVETLRGVEKALARAVARTGRDKEIRRLEAEVERLTAIEQRAQSWVRHGTNPAEIDTAQRILTGEAR